MPSQAAPSPRLIRQHPTQATCPLSPCAPAQPPKCQLGNFNIQAHTYLLLILASARCEPQTPGTVSQVKQSVPHFLGAAQKTCLGEQCNSHAKQPWFQVLESSGKLPWIFNIMFTVFRVLYLCLFLYYLSNSCYHTFRIFHNFFK